MLGQNWSDLQIARSLSVDQEGNSGPTAPGFILIDDGRQPHDQIFDPFGPARGSELPEREAFSFLTNFVDHAREGFLTSLNSVVGTMKS
jgi:hypothetical protein